MTRYSFKESLQILEDVRAGKYHCTGDVEGRLHKEVCYARTWVLQQRLDEAEDFLEWESEMMAND